MAVYVILNELQDLNSRGTLDPSPRYAQPDRGGKKEFCNSLLCFENKTLPLCLFTFETRPSPYRLQKSTGYLNQPIIKPPFNSKLTQSCSKKIFPALLRIKA
jgi:hypothetical protein